MFGANTNSWSTTTGTSFNAIGQCTSQTTEYSQTTTYIFWVGFPGSIHTGNTVNNYFPSSQCSGNPNAPDPY